MKLNPKLAAMFTDHPASVDETYTEHFRTAMHFSGQMAKASMACALHALVPSMCCTTGSDTIKQLFSEVTHRGPECDEAVAGGPALADRPVPADGAALAGAAGG